MIAFPLGVLCCLGIGQRLTGNNQHNSTLTVGIAAAGFFVLFGTVCTVLGFLGWLRASIMWPTMGTILFGVVWFTKPKVEMRSLSELTAIALMVIPFFLMAMVPIWYRDSLTYHAAMAKQYVLSGGFHHGDLIVFSYFPQSWQSFLAGWICLFPNGSLRLISAWMTFFCACTIHGIARETGANHRQSITATAVALLIPTFIEFGSALYVQNALVLFASLTFFWAKSEDPRQVRLAGVCAGLCASLKLSGLYIVLLIFVWRLWTKKHVTVFLFTALIFASPFYLRNAISTGNPFFPMMWTTFGGAGWDAWRAMAYETTLQHYGAGREAIDFLLLPVRMVMTRDMSQNFQGSIGPVAWTIILWGLYKRKDHFWTLSLAAWAVIWALNVQQIRFLMPLLPVMLAIASSHIPKSNRVMGALILSAVLWGFEPAQMLWKRQATTEVLTNKISKQDFLNQKLPENYPIEKWLNQQDFRKVWLVWMRGYHYYLEKPARIDNVFGAWRFEKMLENTDDPLKLKAQLENAEIDAIVINHRFFLQDNNADTWEGRTAQLKMRFSRLIHSGALTKQYTNGPVSVYSLSDSASSLEDISE
ncbi:MAG: hypothetical protein VXZ96_09180 [Myxococcota bacterium]|nr:hypothetical protein [Myxococcota bacterium]MEC8380478.1 hypothetical protein [Myxococcota bacterium]